MTNFPALLTCADPISASASITFEHSDFFISHAVATASAMAPFGNERTAAFIAFIPFIAFMAFIAPIAQVHSRRGTPSHTVDQQR